MGAVGKWSVDRQPYVPSRSSTNKKTVAELNRYGWQICEHCLRRFLSTMVGGFEAQFARANEDFVKNTFESNESCQTEQM
jgi:uncharacterized radical SAM superfamily protein